MDSTKSATIPVVDLSSFATSQGNDEARLKASQELFDACHVLGFAYIVGHGLPNDLLREAFEHTKKLFDLSHDEKMRAPHPANAIPHRGYSAPGIEKIYSKDDLENENANQDKASSLRKIRDHKESFEIGSEQNPAQPNIWLPEEKYPGFRAFTTKLYWELDRVAKRVLEAISLGLKLTGDDRERIFRYHSGHNNQMRLLHYPPIEARLLKEQVVERMPAHQDWSSFTFLFQDNVGGLELEDPRQPGTFLLAKPIPGACVFNIGDMLQRFSNGIFSSALHRVGLLSLDPTSQSSESQNITSARYSIPYFFAPDNDVTVHCLASCVTDDRPANYEPVKWAEYGEYISKYMYKKGGERSQTQG